MRKILFVEDDEAFFSLCAMELKLKNYDVVHVSDGSKAIEVIKSERPDVVLLDIVLPGMSGLDILKELKETAATKDIKTIMLTNFGTDDNVNKAMELGADDYLMKYNVVPSELPEKIASVIGESTQSALKVTN